MPPKLEAVQKNEQDFENVAANDATFNPKDKEYEQFKASVKAGVSGLMERTSSLFKRAGGAVVETGWKSLFAGAKGAQKLAEGVRSADQAVRSGAEMATDKIIEAKDSTVEMARAGKERVVDLVETTRHRASVAGNNIALAIESAKDAAVNKTMNGVENAKTAVRSGVEAATAYGASVYEKAQSKMTGAWEAMKQKVNDIKRERIIAKLELELKRSNEAMESAEHARGEAQRKLEKAKGGIVKAEVAPKEAIKGNYYEDKSYEAFKRNRETAQRNLEEADIAKNIMNTVSVDRIKQQELYGNLAHA